MSQKVAVEFKAIERKNTGHDEKWIARFMLDADGIKQSFEIEVLDSKDPDDLIKMAKATLHDFLRSAVERTKSWARP